MIKAFIFSLIFFSAAFCNKSSDKGYTTYKCGYIDKEPKGMSLKNVAPLKSETKNKRALNSNGFHDFNIFLDLKNFDDEIKKYKLEDIRELLVNGMQKAKKTLESLLQIKYTYNYVFYDEQLKYMSINNWDKTKIGTENFEQGIGMIDLGIDLYIFFRFGDSNELGENVLASSIAYYLDGKTSQPLVGIVNINREVDYSKKNSLEYFETLMLHEFTHILGFSRFYFINYFHNYLTKTDKYGIERVYINSTRVVNAGKKYFNCDSLEGVELENFGGSGLAGSHWEGRILLGEYMNSNVYGLDRAISELTLALLEDTGYYKANYYTGGLMQFGRNKGCEFLDSKCINNKKVNPDFSNEFFYDIYNTFLGGLDYSCSSGRQSRGYHGLINYNYEIPEEFRYYNLRNRGGLSYADYCPVSVDLATEVGNIYYVGSCTKMGGENYGSDQPYTKDGKYTSGSGYLSSITGEYLSSNSFCVLSSLISENITNYKSYSKNIRAICYQMHCSDKSLTIQINNNFIVCPRAGGKIKAQNFDGYLLCPDYNLICSATVLCNDLFDCVEKKSELKDIEYDYISKTTQDYGNYSSEGFSEAGYELSNNGKCPINCCQCDELGQCLKCREGLILNSESKCESENQDTKDCPPGQYYSEILKNCVSCPNGQYLDEETVTCKICPAGSYSLEGNTTCIKCSAGTYSSKNESSSCSPCPAGTFSEEGSSSCTKCPVGFYSNEGASSCLCNGGKYLLNNKCYCCAAGYYSYPGSLSCTKCPAGEYSSYSCSSSCNLCPAGTYTALTGSSYCNKCLAGTYSNAGSTRCTQCPAGRYASSKGSSYLNV